MGGLGSHHVHPYALQFAAFLFSMLFPASLLALVGGAIRERFHRRHGRPAAPPAHATLATGRLAPLGE
jgi:hypothetical protein